MQVILTFKVASHGILLSPFPRYSVVPVIRKYVKQISKAINAICNTKLQELDTT